MLKELSVRTPRLWSRSLPDPNIISNVTKPAPSEALVVWMAGQADEKARKRPSRGAAPEPLDMIIAAVAEANRCVIVTENERDFASLKVVNPFELTSICLGRKPALAGRYPRQAALRLCTSDQGANRRAHPSGW
jgi:predicted nucleic acid-binding protein